MGFVLQLFGGFRLISGQGQSILLPDRVRALLAYLAAELTPVPRQVLAELLSEGGDEPQQRTVLRQTIYLARKATTKSAIISTQEGDLVLDQALVNSDVRRFRDAIARHDAASLKDAVELYRGPFLDGEKSSSSEFEGWLGARRAEFLECALEALLALARSDEAAGLHRSAVGYARRALTLDSLREDAHRQLMRCLAAMGQRSSALRQYEIARKALAEDLGVAPEDETEALRASIANGGERFGAVAEPIVPEQLARQARIFSLGGLRGRRRAVTILTLMCLTIVGGTAIPHIYPRLSTSNNLPSVAVLPFMNTSGDPGQDYLGRGVAVDIITMLSTDPRIRVVPRPMTGSGRTEKVQQLAQELGVRYVLEGSVQRSTDEIHVTAQLIDASTGDHVWSRHFEGHGDNLAGMQEQIASKIYVSLVGFRGEIASQEQRHAWGKSTISLEEHDYVMRGEQLYFQFTKAAHARARQIWWDGLRRFPNSKRLRVYLAASYRHSVEAGWSKDREKDLEKAWQLASEAALPPHGSRLDQWQGHWLMAKLTQWCKQDFGRSVAEARAAIELVPYDASSRADLAELMANAGRTEDAIAWLQEAIRRNLKRPEWYTANLAWAYYLANRQQDALAELQKLTKPRHLLLAAVHVRLGQFEAARAFMREYLERSPNHTLADEARRPLIESLKRGWLDDLREAGLPDLQARQSAILP